MLTKDSPFHTVHRSNVYQQWSARMFSGVLPLGSTVASPENPSLARCYLGEDIVFHRLHHCWMSVKRTDSTASMWIYLKMTHLTITDTLLRSCSISLYQVGLRFLISFYFRQLEQNISWSSRLPKKRRKRPYIVFRIADLLLFMALGL